MSLPTMREPELVALLPHEAARLLAIATPRDTLDAELLEHLRRLVDRCTRYRTPRP